MADVVEKIVRSRIHESLYWKIRCFGINAASLVDRAVDITSVGGLYANQRPTDFLCLVYKLVLIRPEREIIEEMLHQPYFKYLTAVAATYVRLLYPPIDVYRLLEPLLEDYRKLRLVPRSGPQRLWYIDELADALLNEERVFDLALPRMPSRLQLEEVGLEPRQSPLELDEE